MRKEAGLNVGLIDALGVIWTMLKPTKTPERVLSERELKDLFDNNTDYAENCLKNGKRALEK